MSEDKKDFDWIDVGELQPWIKNPRFNDVAVVPVANSIEEFGFGAPIVVQAGTNMIIAGHTRLKAALRLGWKKVPCRILEISDRNAERLAIADNKTNEIADWNEEHLEDILAGFEPEELENIGFNEEELQQLLDHPSEEESLEEPPTPPKPVNTNQTFTLLKGDCLERLKELEDGSIDSIVTDPPYMINFMNKKWDSEDRDVVDNVELWLECLRVLKAGGHLIAFCATRTIHRMTTKIEDAGFDIRDQLCWCYESGFPKSLNVSLQFDENSEEAKRFDGWGTALKPAFEPAVLARKPLDGTIANNFLQHGVGGLNIEATRFPYGDPIWFGDQSIPDNFDQMMTQRSKSTNTVGNGFGVSSIVGIPIRHRKEEGRWPANIVRFKKPSRSERDQGLDHLKGKNGFDTVDRKKGSAGVQNPRAGAGRTSSDVKNFHPTVKPVDLMRWLVRLVTPMNGTVLDPFLGSGTTAAAAILEGFNVIGCEITEEYWPIIQGRVENAKRNYLEGFENGKKDKDQ